MLKELRLLIYVIHEVFQNELFGGGGFVTLIVRF
jgi:hypothetical protein